MSPDMRQRAIVGLIQSVLAVIFFLVASARLAAAEINLDYVTKLAQTRAQKPFRSPRADLPDVL